MAKSRKRKSDHRTLAVLSAGVFLLFSACSAGETNNTTQSSQPNQQTVMANLILTEVKKHEPEPTETLLPTQPPTSTPEPTHTPEPTATMPIIVIPSQIPPGTASEQTGQTTDESPAHASTIAELQPNNTGYSEAELIASGRSALVQADGTKYFEGFFVLPSGNYWPMNTSALQSGNSSASQTLGSVPAAASDYSAPSVASDYSAPVSAAPVDTANPVQSDCNPNYDVCLPNVADLNCPDISYRYFRVIGKDVYRLDGDGNGIACESSR